MFRLGLGVLLVVLGAAMFVGRDPPTTAPNAPPPYGFALQPRLSGWSDTRLRRTAGETDMEFLTRTTRLVSESIYHCDYHNTPRVVDWITSRVFPGAFNDVGLLTPQALPCGFCHQVAYVLARALRNGGVDAEPMVLNGHVVTIARVGGRRWLVDADFGVGPVEYPVSFSVIEAEYRRVTGQDDNWTAQIAAAYSTVADDQPFYTMAWLDETEFRQRWLISFLEKTRWGLVVAGLVLIVARRRGTGLSS